MKYRKLLNVVCFLLGTISSLYAQRTEQMLEKDGNSAKVKSPEPNR